MSERTKLLKKAVMTGVGASTNVDRIKVALNEALEDLVRVGQDLLEDLESKGEIKAKSAQDFFKNFQENAKKKGGNIEKNVSSKVQGSMKKVVKEMGLATKEEVKELSERLEALEDALTGGCEDHDHEHEHEPKKARAGKGKRSAE
jgi:polyhydroxyalkanoate synthesis regulator phasin